MKFVFLRKVAVRAVLVSLLVFVIPVLVKTIWFLRMTTPAAALLAGQQAHDILARRAYLLSQVRDKRFGPASMPFFLAQVMKEEWAIGTASMVTAALTNIAFEYEDTRTESLDAVQGLIQLMLSAKLRNFEVRWWKEDALDTLSSDNGHIGYLGHLNFMFGAQRMLGGDRRYEKLHRDISTTLARRIMNSPSSYLETFPGIIFTADNVVVMASLGISRRFFDAGQEQALVKWKAYTKAKVLDKQTGLFPFYVTSAGEPSGPVRGSAAGWNSFYLPFFDEEFARQQYQSMKVNLVSTLPIGVTGIREFLPGIRGYGDIDSGPVVFGLSTSGTGFAVAGARRWQDGELLEKLLFTAELAGSSIETDGKRRYLLAPLVGEAIMLAMKTARQWDSRYLPAA